MTNINNILLGLKFGETDQQLLAYVNKLMPVIRPEYMKIVHIIPKSSIDNPAFRNSRPIDGLIEEMVLNKDLIDTIKKEVRIALPAIENTKLEIDIRDGNPLEEILSEAADTNADLIVMGFNSDAASHGILAKKLSRKVKNDALVVPSAAESGIEKILVPIDFSPNSVKAMQKALAFRKALGNGASVTLLYVYDLPNISTYQLSRTREQFREIMHENIMDGFNHFLDAYAKEDKDHIEIAMDERDLPDTGHHIVHYAKNNDMDIIFMGAKGHSKVELLLMGSVTEKVLALNKKIPVWVVK